MYWHHFVIFFPGHEIPYNICSQVEEGGGETTQSRFFIKNKKVQKRHGLGKSFKCSLYVRLFYIWKHICFVSFQWFFDWYFGWLQGEFRIINSLSCSPEKHYSGKFSCFFYVLFLFLSQIFSVGCEENYFLFVKFADESRKQRGKAFLNLFKRSSRDSTEIGQTTKLLFGQPLETVMVDEELPKSVMVCCVSFHSYSTYDSDCRIHLVSGCLISLLYKCSLFYSGLAVVIV